MPAITVSELQTTAHRPSTLWYLSHSFRPPGEGCRPWRSVATNPLLSIWRCRWLPEDISPSWWSFFMVLFIVHHGFVNFIVRDLLLSFYRRVRGLDVWASTKWMPPHTHLARCSVPLTSILLKYFTYSNVYLYTRPLSTCDDDSENHHEFLHLDEYFDQVGDTKHAHTRDARFFRRQSFWNSLHI